MRRLFLVLLLALATAAPARAHPAPAPEPGAGRFARVPILMYHVVARPPGRVPFPQLYVSPLDFRAQVRWLEARGYTAVTLGEVYAHWRHGAPLPARPVVLSFDDGYRSDYTVAGRILAVRGWPGVLNLEVNNLQPSWGLRPRLVRRLIAQGWELDAHTITHPDLTTLDGARLREEVAGSRRELRRRFHVAVDFFCYPSGRYDDAVVAAVRAAGYEGATTVVEGLATPADLFTLPRVRVDGSDGVRGLAAKLAALGLPA